MKTTKAIRIEVAPLNDGMIVFPGMRVPILLEVDIAPQQLVLLLPRQPDGTLSTLGVIARVWERMPTPFGGSFFIVECIHRGQVQSGLIGDTQGKLWAEVIELPDSDEYNKKLHSLMLEYRALTDEILDIIGNSTEIIASLRAITNPGLLADSIGYSRDVGFEQKLEILETLDIPQRLNKAVQMQRECLEEMRVRKDIQQSVATETSKQQREFILRKQLESIQRELGEDGSSIIDEYEEQIANAGMPESVRVQADRELKRLERLGETPESSMIRSYLEWMLSVPWAKRSEDILDPIHARKILDQDHYGLENVKERIVEHLAVRLLRQDRGIADDHKSGAILTLVGPPGTGKTSVGESIARAMGREFIRFSLGGVHDEAEIRGHRRTYIGALPGRLVRALRDAGTMNPVIMLDEIDKVGSDWRGDPSAALLEALDPAQNHTFRDHYLDVDLDLSQVFFITTANQTEAIPPALLDRMEVINFDGYTIDEKVAIAINYLWPRQRERSGLLEGEIKIESGELETIIAEYTHEAGVRQLERELGKIARKAATKLAAKELKPPIKVDIDFVREALGRQHFFREVSERTDVPGVATGLAVTNAGGDVLFVEATSMKGEEKLLLTGQLGDVMKESARIALSYLQAHTKELGISEDAFVKRGFHIHVPAGAIPKDGPSAGITMTCALASLLTARPVKHTFGMTGEITLQGKVLPIGGIKQKVLAAHAAGITDIILPLRNEGDLEEVPEEVRQQMVFHPVSNISEVLKYALEEIENKLPF